MTDDVLADLRLSADTLGCDLFVVPAPVLEDQMDAIRKRRGEGRHMTVSAMAAQTLRERQAEG